MIRRPPRSTLFPYTTPLPIYDLAPRRRKESPHACGRARIIGLELLRRRFMATPELEQTARALVAEQDRKSTRLNSSHANISYAVFCLKKKNNYLLNRHLTCTT